MDDREWVEFTGRAGLRSWLVENHARQVGVWAVYPRTGARESDLSWDALVAEFLCFGWIDSLPGKVDDRRTRTYIAPRRPRSGWSRRNQVLVGELERAGLMHESGAAVVAAAKADGSWALFDLAEDLVIPPVIEESFASHPEAREGFAAYPERTRKSLLQWFYSARTDATRLRRRDAIVDAAARGATPGLLATMRCKHLQAEACRGGDDVGILQ